MKFMKTSLKRRFDIVALCAVMAALSAIPGCSRDEPTLRPLNQNAIIVAFGDSLTFGTGANTNESYPAELAKQIGRTVINSGIPGEVSRDGLARLDEVLEREKPALMILCHGGNDLLRKLDRKQLKSNLTAMIENARRKGVDVVLLGVPEPTLLMRSTAAVYVEVATELNVPFDSETLAKIESDDALKSDYVHPNAQGYLEMARAVTALLKRYGAVK